MGYWTGEDQEVSLGLRGQVMEREPGVEPEAALRQVVGRSALLVPKGCRSGVDGMML
jgi:hypothetical protein